MVCACLLAAAAAAVSVPGPVLVEAGEFVKIYDPSVGEKAKWYINDHCFIRGEDGYSVMIGMVCDGKPTVGVVYQPVIDRLFHGTPDGAWMTMQGQTTRLAVSPIDDVADIRLVASKSHRSPDLDRVKHELGVANELNIGSVGVKLCVIAAGLRDLYVNPATKTKAWDTCAPEAILVPAGGRLSDLFGQPIDYTKELAHRHGLVASNGRVHDAVVAKLAPMFPHLA